MIFIYIGLLLLHLFPAQLLRARPSIAPIRAQRLDSGQVRPGPALFPAHFPDWQKMAEAVARDQPKVA